MSTTTRTTYSPTFQNYLDNTFIPAQDWALSDDGTAWIEKNIPTLKTLIKKHYDSCLFAVYCIKINGTPLYVGESIRPIRRLCVHAYDFRYYPERYGLEEENLGTNIIEVELLETSIFYGDCRWKRKLNYIAALKPIIQKCTGSCIPINRRSEKVLPFLLNKAL